MFKKIDNYGIIGDLHTVSLIGVDGSIDWLCFPHIDSPSIFSALLDDKKGGRFQIAPADQYDSFSEYISDTNVLTTTFRTATGVMRLTDFMPIPAFGEEELEEKHHELYRLIEVTKGELRVFAIFAPRFDYARIEATITKHGNSIIAKGNGESLSLSSTRELNIKSGMADGVWNMKEGERAWLHLRYDSDEPLLLNEKNAERLLEDTIIYWKSWLNKTETGRKIDLGEYKSMVNRSALVLKLLYYNKTGAIAAAATTSLPEVIRGGRNWDYRYTWVRDTSFTLQALFNIGHISETEGYIRWMEKLISESGAKNLQIMYSLDGRKELPEVELSHLSGYKGSRPVRIGNEAANQRQMDIYGELMDASLKLSDYVGKIDSKVWPSLKSICDYVADNWHDRDNGIWEVRGGPYHFVYSKVMCWVALDRGLTIAKRYGFPGDTKRWNKEKEKIKDEVLNKGWNADKGAFRQHYETDALDSSNLLIPLLGFLPFSDPRIASNLEATMNDLLKDGFLYRYISEDGLSGDEGAFLLCTFWLIDNLIALKRIDEAKHYLSIMKGVANNLGLFSEEYDVKFKEMLGNFPQAFTHIGCINSVTSLLKAEGIFFVEETNREVQHSMTLFSDKILLNDGSTNEEFTPANLAANLKNSMNVLRGSFFDLDKGRIAYEKMYNSNAYSEHVALSRALKSMDLNDIKTRDDKLSFWINLYNVIVIHGVIALKIRDSVKEVRNFFKRVEYQIGDMRFSPDDIEHGILRGNAVPPNSIFRQFKGNDNRLKFVIKEFDPRIHFALVCGSSSCPPIEVYTSDNIDEELTIASEAFVNGGGIIVNQEKREVHLSRIFKWYASDFGKDKRDRLLVISKYMYNKDDKAFIEKNASDIKVLFQEYDWHLNKES